MATSSELFLQGQQAAAAGNQEAAEAAYRALLRDEPHHFSALRALASLLEGRGESEEAALCRAEADGCEARSLCEGALSMLASGEERSAAALIARALSLAPEEPAALRAAALLAGRGGDRAAAEELHASLARKHPGEREAELALAVLRGMSLPLSESYSAYPIPPHVLIERFLPPAEREAALSFALSNMDRLCPASVFRGEAINDEKARSSRVIFRPEELAEWFLPRISAALPRVFSRIAMAPFSPGRIELQLTYHGDGDFYRVHADRGVQDSPAGEEGVAKKVVGGRLVTFVYYFGRVPQRFEGGELYLYRSAGGGEGYDPASAFALAPRDNTIVFFPSVLYHEVRPVRLASPRPGDGRFTLNGWIHLGEEA